MTHERVFAALAATATLANGFAFAPSVRCAGNIRPGASWVGEAQSARSRVAPCRVMTDVDEVVGTETEEASTEVQVAFAEPPTRFDKIKESYKGVTTALDLSEETAAYDDFQSLLTDHKVREEAFTWARGVGSALLQICVHTQASCGTNPPPYMYSRSPLCKQGHFVRIYSVYEATSLGYFPLSSRRLSLMCGKAREMRSNLFDESTKLLGMYDCMFVVL